MHEGKRALLVRFGPYDVTQALPRAAKTLQSMGYDVTILSLDTSFEEPLEEHVEGFRVVRLRFRYRSGKRLSFFLAWLKWWLWVHQQLRRESFDLVQASNIESLVPCAIARMTRDFALVFDIRDLWGMSVDPSERVLVKAFSALERWGARRSDAMVLCPAPLGPVATYFGEAVCADVPVTQVINVPSVDFSGGYDPPNTNEFRLNYSGHISVARNARAIIEFSHANPHVQVDVVGDISDAGLARDLSRAPNIECHGRVSLLEAMDLLRRASLICLMYDVRTQIAVISTPNKMFEAMMMSRPYVASYGGFPSAFAAEYGVGWSVPYDDADALTRLVRDLVTSPELVESASRRAREAYDEFFQWETQEENLRGIYEFAIGVPEARFTATQGWLKFLGRSLAVKQDGVGEVV